MSTETKIGVGSALAALGALAIVLSVLLEWTAVPAPWDVLLGFVLGVITGLGGTLAVAGLIERRRAG